jgi:tRNA pseudouridine55 synthase
MQPEEGRVLLVNKPIDWTSFDVVNKLRYRLKTKKIGHAGTLDPLATGLLIICVGKMTKQIDQFQAQEKEYTGVFVLGQSTPSHDLETLIGERLPIDHLTAEDIRKAALKFTGTIQQVPPLHSAIKVNGQRAYKLARKGEGVELKSREVVISELDIMKIEMPKVYFRVICSKGTYIRSLARDFGNELGVGAYLTDLCRTRIGSFSLADAKNVDEIE